MRSTLVCNMTKSGCAGAGSVPEFQWDRPDSDGSRISLSGMLRGQLTGTGRLRLGGGGGGATAGVGRQVSMVRHSHGGSQARDVEV